MEVARANIQAALGNKSNHRTAHRHPRDAKRNGCVCVAAIGRASLCGCRWRLVGYSAEQRLAAAFLFITPALVGHRPLPAGARPPGQQVRVAIQRQPAGSGMGRIIGGAQAPHGAATSHALGGRVSARRGGAPATAANEFVWLPSSRGRRVATAGTVSEWKFSRVGIQLITSSGW